MKIEYSLVDAPSEHFTVKDVTSYTYTESECLIFNARGLVLTIPERDIEDFAVSLEV